MNTNQAGTLLPQITEEDKTRFWAKAAKRGHEECWEWMLSRSSSNYGRVRFQRGYFGAHRLAWILTNGPIPDGLCILHKCDNPPCVNPAHLFLGTQTDNMADCAGKGRFSTGEKHRATLSPSKGEKHYAKVHPEWLARGESHGNAKLTESEVVEMRRLYTDSHLTQKAIGLLFHVERSHVSRIVRGKVWSR